MSKSIRAACVTVITCRGPDRRIVDLEIFARPTRECPPEPHVLEELRVSAAAGRIRRARR